MSSLTDLATAVSALDAAVASAVADIKTLTDQITAANAGVNPAIDAAVTDINSRVADLTTAVNPPAPTPPAPPAA